MLITNFASGELSATLNGRTDLGQYYQGAGRIENFDIIPTGGIKRRSGTERLAQLHNDCRLIPMILDSNTCFIFEIVPDKDTQGSSMYIWLNGEKYMEASGAQMRYDVPWTSLEEIKQVQYAQNYDTMIFVQKEHEPVILKYENSTFTVGAMTFDFTPDVVLDDDFDQVYSWDDEALPDYNIFESPKTQESKVYLYLIYRGILYKWNNEENYTKASPADKVYWEKDDSVTEYEMDWNLFTTTSRFPGAVAFFNSRLYFASTRESQQKVWASSAPDITGTRYNEFSTYVKYVTVNKVIKDADVHYFSGSCIEGEKTITGISQKFKDIANIVDYYVSSNAFPSGTKVISYNEGTNSLVLDTAATSTLTSSVMSIQLWKNVNSPENADYEFKVINTNMTNADNAFYFEVASDQNDAIKWLAAGKYLVIGSESANYVVPSGSNGLNIAAYLDGRYGTDDIQATTIQTAVLFFSQGKNAVREYYYNSASEAFISNDLALFNHEILNSKAVDFDFMTNPYSRVLITREDGTIAVLLYEKSLGIMAWGNLILGKGRIQSVAVTRGEGTSDLIYLSVKHENDFYLERIDLNKEEYLDSWKTFKDEDLEVYTDEAVIYNKTTDKEITVKDFKDIIKQVFINEGDEVIIGYSYKSLIRSMPIVAQDSTGQKRITNLLVRFYNSYRPELEVTGRKAEQFTGFTEPFSGIKDIVYPGDSDRDVTFTLSMEKTKPCTILAVNAKLA